jgi:uncharacterized RDD family membrane protein YckC
MMSSDEQQQSKKTGLKGEEDSNVKLTIDDVDTSAKSVFDEDPLKSLVIKSPAKVQSSEVRVEKFNNATELPRSSTSSTEAKPLPLVLRRIVAAIIDAMIVGFGGALIISILFVALNLAHPTPPPPGTIGLNLAVVLIFYTCAALLAFNWICPIALILLCLACLSSMPNLDLSTAFWQIGLAIISPLYDGMCVASSLQGTIGKRLLGLVVQTNEGNRLSFGRAILRHLARGLSFITVVGYIIGLFGKKHSCLHDLTCETEVVGRKPSDEVSKTQIGLSVAKQNMTVCVVLSIVIGIVLRFAIDYLYTLKYLMNIH